MKFWKTVIWSGLLVITLNACATSALVAEQNARMSQEQFTSEYRIAVVTYQIAADAYASPIVHDPLFMIQQGEARKALREVIQLEKLDAAMVTLVRRSIPATAEVLEVAASGAILKKNDIGKVSQQALRIALERGYQAVLLVGVKPVMISEFAGMKDFDIKLSAVTQLHKISPQLEKGGETLLLSQADSVYCTPYVVEVNASQFKTMVDDCVDPLVARIDESLTRRLAER